MIMPVFDSATSERWNVTPWVAPAVSTASSAPQLTETWSTITPTPPTICKASPLSLPTSKVGRMRMYRRIMLSRPEISKVGVTPVNVMPPAGAV